MCQSIVFNGERLDGIDDAIRVLGAENIVIEPGRTLADMLPNECLCWVDMAATAKACGCDEAEHDCDPMEHLFVRRDIESARD